MLRLKKFLRSKENTKSLEAEYHNILHCDFREKIFALPAILQPPLSYGEIICISDHTIYSLKAYL